MLSSSHLEYLLHNNILEALVAGSNFLESFIHAYPVSTYLLDFVFAFTTISKQTVSSCVDTRLFQAILLSDFN